MSITDHYTNLLDTMEDRVQTAIIDLIHTSLKLNNAVSRYRRGIIAGDVYRTILNELLNTIVVLRMALSRFKRRAYLENRPAVINLICGFEDDPHRMEDDDDGMEEEDDDGMEEDEEEDDDGIEEDEEEEDDGYESHV